MALALIKSNDKSKSKKKPASPPGSVRKGMFWSAAIGVVPVAIWFWAPIVRRAQEALGAQGIELTADHVTLANLLGLPALALVLAAAAGIGGWKYLPKNPASRWALSLGWFCWVFALNAAFIAWLSHNF